PSPVPSPVPTPSPSPTPKPLSVTATATPSSGGPPLAVTFTSTVTGGTAPYTYSWNFGDSASSTAANPSHTYSAIGTYTARVSVTDSKGQATSFPLTITVAVPPLIATASANPTTGDAPLSVSFTGSASGGLPPYTYSWDMGHGAGTPTSQNPPYTYHLPGTYTATLTVTDSTTPTASTATATVTITVNPPVPQISGLSPNFGPETGG